MKNLYKIIFLCFFFFITFNLTEAKAADYPLCDPEYTNERGYNQHPRSEFHQLLHQKDR